MTRDTTKISLIAAVVLLVLCLGYAAYSRPGSFSSETYLAGLIGLELIVATLCRFRQTFFPLLMIVFLWAGSGLPGSSLGTEGRWVLLAVGALAGGLIALKESKFRVGFFHLVSLSCVLTALVSAAVSRHPRLAALKALSLFLLFFYASTGARLAIEGRENRFLNGLATGCEILVAGIALFYVAGIEVLGNPNSLGAVTGVVAIPILLWAILAFSDRASQRRRAFIFVVAVVLTFHSHARAAMLAALISSALLCLCLRRYKLLAQGFACLMMFVALTAILRPEIFSGAMSDLTSNVVYKNTQDQEVFSSRQGPWQEAMDAIRAHPWFGTGFGTTENGQGEAGFGTANFSSYAAVSAEYGSSYLAIVAWVGIAGALPFFCLLAIVIKKSIRTFRWVRTTGSGLHPAVPLALVVVAGIIHAGLEDWMFAVGYYLSAFFWILAFIVVAIAPAPLPTREYSRYRPAVLLPSDSQLFVSGR